MLNATLQTMVSKGSTIEGKRIAGNMQVEAATDWTLVDGIATTAVAAIEAV